MNLLFRDHQYAIHRLVVVAIALGFGLWGCSETTGPEEVVIPVPVVSGVDTTTVSVGDTLTVTGSDFDDDIELNRVVFNNTLARAVPFDGTTTELSVVVPRNALSGDISVTRAGQTEAGPGPEVTVLRGVGDVFVVGGARSVDIPTPPGAEYVVVPHATGGLVTKNHQYALSGVGLPPTAMTGAVATSADGATGEPRDVGAGVPVHGDFESMLRRVAREVRDRIGPPLKPERKMGVTPEAPQQFRQFNVWNRQDKASGSDPNNYTTVTAELRYTGQHVLVYTDVDTLATDNLTLADLKNLGSIYDADIHPVAARYFGAESDVDGNGKVIILITPVVNSLTPRRVGYLITGFFFDVDLFSTSQMPAGTTNHAEMFYLLASDPVGQWSDPRERTQVAEKNIMTTAHENEHLISISWRRFNERANSLQATWLEEGMAHVSEDLLALETGKAQYNADNEGRGLRYRLNPGAISLEDSESPLSQRGGIYLFLRLLGDRYGNDIYKQILQSDCVGRECIQRITGENFYDTLADFLVAMYVSGTGITADARYNYDSIDLVDFGALYSVAAAFDGDNVGNQLRRTSGDFFVFSGSSTAMSRVTVSTTSSDMGLRTVFVRTK